MKNLSPPAALIVTVLVLAATSFAQSKIDFLQRGRDYTTQFYDGKASEIWENLTPEMKKVFGEPDAIMAFRFQIKTQDGSESSVVEEHVSLQGDFVQYQRIAMFQKVSSPVIVQWTFDRNGAVAGFYVRPDVPGESRFLDYKDKTAFRLPFKGQWLVLSGGRNVSENHHADTVDQRFAVDLATVRHGRTFSGEGTRPEQYFCFGQAVLAPADGTVVDVHDGIPDNPINAPFSSPPAGNYVVIDYGNSEYSFQAHLKLGSIRVRTGEKVRAGEKIGKCGNSGNAPVPHLHMHLQNSPVLFAGEGLPLQFQNFVGNKKFEENAELMTGEIVRNKPPK